MKIFFSDYLQLELSKAEKNKKLKVKSTGYTSYFKSEHEMLNKLDFVHNGVKEYYERRGTFFGEWVKNGQKGIGGSIQFAKTKYLFSDPKENGIYYDDQDENDLKYFHPLDYPSPESYVGFIIKPDQIYNSLYYMSIGDYELQNLDLDFEGYTQMALEARVFNGWQVVLLYYMDGFGIGEVETELFKTEMPQLFEDWAWESFISKFESLRLSKQNK